MSNFRIANGSRRKETNPKVSTLHFDHLRVVSDNRTSGRFQLCSIGVLLDAKFEILFLQISFSRFVPSRPSITRICRNGCCPNLRSGPLQGPWEMCLAKSLVKLWTWASQNFSIQFCDCRPWMRGWILWFCGLWTSLNAAMSRGLNLPEFWIEPNSMGHFFACCSNIFRICYFHLRLACISRRSFLPFLITSFLPAMEIDHALFPMRQENFRKFGLGGFRHHSIDTSLFWPWIP
jgi:hypothetical protein